MHPKCPACGDHMETTWMASRDRFFSDVWQWECECGFVASQSVLDESAKCEEALRRFRLLDAPMLPSPAPPPAQPGATEIETQPRCRHCGRDLKVYKRDPDDRFRDVVESCSCKPRRPVEPLEAEPQSGRAWNASWKDLMPRESRPSRVPKNTVLEPTDKPMPAPALWAKEGYLVQARTLTFVGQIGLPRVLTDLEVRGGKEADTFPRGALPKGVHLALGPLVRPDRIVTEVREELLGLYEELLNLQPQSIFEGTGSLEALPHWMALLAHFSEQVSELPGAPIEYLKASLEGEEAVYKAFLEKLCHLPFLPSRLVPLSIFDLAAEEAQGSQLETLELKPDETRILERFILGSD